MKKSLLILLLLSFSLSATKSQNCHSAFSAISNLGGGSLFIVDSSMISGIISYDSSYIDYGDGIKIHFSSLGATLTHFYNTGGAYNVCLKISDSLSNCSNTSCHTFNIPYWGCTTQFFVTNTDSTYYFTATTIGGISPYNYSWTIYDSVNGSILYTGNSTNPIIIDSQFHSMMVSLQSIDSVGCVSTTSNNVYVGGGGGGNNFCNAFFSIYPDTTTPHHYYGYNLSSGGLLHYNWNWGDGNYDTLPYPTHIYASSAYYNISLMVWSNIGGQFCMDSFKLNYLVTKQTQANTIYSISILSSTGINKISSLKSLKVYPNPASAELNVELNGEKMESVKIISLNGQVALQASSLLNKINISELNAGIYFVEVKTNNNIYRTKFVKE